ncbi:MAG: GNAT family N-acetyltransferase [Pseudomonadota bacterium]
MIFRSATNKDIPVLRALEQKVIEAERPFNDAIKRDSAIYYDIEDLIANDASCLLVAEVDGEIIGTGYVQIRDSKPCFSHQQHAYLGFMYVSPDYRGQRINAKIVDRLIAWSKERGVMDCYLHVYSDNAPAIRAYEKVGFESLMVEMKLSIEP